MADIRFIGGTVKRYPQVAAVTVIADVSGIQIRDGTNRIVRQRNRRGVIRQRVTQVISAAGYRENKHPIAHPVTNRRSVDVPCPRVKDRGKGVAVFAYGGIVRAADIISFRQRKVACIRGFDDHNPIVADVRLV
ncbi:hypothetical protein D3C74_287290 [compost metagenome]